jgi:hypothetical protein
VAAASEHQPSGVGRNSKLTAPFPKTPTAPAAVGAKLAREDAFSRTKNLTPGKTQMSQAVPIEPEPINTLANIPRRGLPSIFPSDLIYKAEPAVACRKTP